MLKDKNAQHSDFFCNAAVKGHRHECDFQMFCKERAKPKQHNSNHPFQSGRHTSLTSQHFKLDGRELTSRLSDVNPIT